MNRRNFLKTMGLITLASTLPASSIEVQEPPRYEYYNHGAECTIKVTYFNTDFNLKTSTMDIGTFNPNEVVINGYRHKRGELYYRKCHFTKLKNDRFDVTYVFKRASCFHEMDLSVYGTPNITRELTMRESKRILKGK